MYDRPFRWWVQSVMPLVFDDSLSYYEVLAKLTKYIEGLTGDVEQIEKILATIDGIGDVTQFTEFLERIQAEIGNLDNLQTDTKASLVSAINEVALKADIAYWKPPTGIPESDLSQEVKDKLNRAASPTEYIINNVKLNPSPANNSPTDLGLGTYTVPEGGIPWNTLSSDVRDRITGSGSGGTTNYDDLNNKPQINGHTLNAGNNTAESLELGTYNKPIMGIPESDLTAEVQEKLNTSGGIADSESSFVATRDYAAGELVYINGQLYRTKYNILTGTNLIPGNNIEATDISSELEKINSDIDALQSDAGPDSWNLTDTVQSYSYLEKIDFFEYFNCIGGENYNFIVEPTDPSNAVAYYLDVCKRDGTVVLSQHVTEAVDYANRKRFTFVPTDSGEYYCKFYRTASGYPTTTSAVKVTIEYTQSQGMTELWSKVNEAIAIGEDVNAIEALVNQHSVQLQELDGIPERVENLETDVTVLKNTVTENADILPFATITGSYIGGDGSRKNSSGFNIKKYLVSAGDQLILDIAFPFVSSGGVFQFQSDANIPTSSNPYIIGTTYRRAFEGTVIVPDGASFLMVTVKSGQVDNNIIQVVKPKNYEIANKVEAIEKNSAFEYSDYGLDGVESNNGFTYTKNGPIVKINGERTGSVTIGTSLTTDYIVAISNDLTDASFTNPNLSLKSGRRYLARIKFISGSITNTSSSSRSHDFRMCYYNGNTATSEILGSVTLEANETIGANTIDNIVKIIEPAEDVQCGFVWACRGYLIASDFTVIFYIEDITEFQTSLIDGNDIVIDNADATNKVLASRWLRSETATPLTLLWFSDIHRDKTNLERIIKYKNYLSKLNMLDDTIATGDIVQGASSEASSSTYFQNFWYNTPGTENILIAVGNHEWYAQGASPHGKITIEQVNELYFNDFANWGAVRESNYPFYYKDYTSQGIRLIVTDPAIVSEADETTWLRNTLANARTNGLSVVIASHYIMLNSSKEVQSATVIDNNWTNNVTRQAQTITMNYDWTSSCDIVECVSEFIADGGSFLCYIVGHSHKDFLCYPTGHPDQLIISIAAATDNRTQTKLTTNDLPRYPDTPTQDAFNVVTFDAENKIVKCSRVGANVNMYEQPRTAFAYDVQNHTFLSVI